MTIPILISDFLKLFKKKEVPPPQESKPYIYYPPTSNSCKTCGGNVYNSRGSGYCYKCDPNIFD